jgi:hypothetical protein
VTKTASASTVTRTSVSTTTCIETVTYEPPILTSDAWPH